jgi:hypothetical protein
VTLSFIDERQILTVI